MKVSFTLVVVVFSVLMSSASPRTPQLTAFPGSVVRGEQVLTTNGCLSCHSLNGKGGTRGSDLAVPSKTAATPALFATSLWNHMPEMLAEFESSRTALPPLRVTDAADLFTYLYATLYFSPRGNVSRGGSKFVEKQCASCHSEVLDTQSRRSFVDSWMDLKDPAIWAERMWNHATEMNVAMSNRGIRWPSLSDQDVVDLVSFLSTRAGTQPELVAFAMGEPEMGRSTFEKSCADCHTLGVRERSKVDLLSRSGSSSITGYIAAMWNHVPAMRRQTGSTPKLNAGEMPDLIAFLFTQRYFFDPGDSGRGRRVYERDCATCHQAQRRATGASDLSESVETFSPVTLTAAAWRHGTVMMGMMKQKGTDWPTFRGREMADLIEYLNSIRIVRVAPANSVP
jgi:cytochrome c